MLRFFYDGLVVNHQHIQELMGLTNHILIHKGQGQFLGHPEGSSFVNDCQYMHEIPDTSFLNSNSHCQSLIYYLLILARVKGNVSQQLVTLCHHATPDSSQVIRNKCKMFIKSRMAKTLFTTDSLALSYYQETLEFSVEMIFIAVLCFFVLFFNNIFTLKKGLTLTVIIFYSSASHLLGIFQQIFFHFKTNEIYYL